MHLSSLDRNVQEKWLCMYVKMAMCHYIRLGIRSDICFAYISRLVFSWFFVSGAAKSYPLIDSLFVLYDFKLHSASNPLK